MAMNELRSGYTTGTCATAAAKGALKSLLLKQPVNEISIHLPKGREVKFPLIDCEVTNSHARCGVRKDAGDDPDATNGMVIYAEVKLHRRKRINILGGDGVGTVMKPGLQIPVGDSAINPVPRRMIKKELECVLDTYDCHRGASVTISVPGGDKIAEKTFNPKLGIEGGISIIGTTGIVKPYSVPAIKKSLELFLEQAKAMENDFVLLVPGNIGEKAAHKRYILHESQIVHMNNYVGHMVRKAAQIFDKIVILGHPAKLLKILLGCYNTHSQKSVSPLPFIRTLIKKMPWSVTLEENLNTIPTVDGIVSHIPREHQLAFFNPLATQIERKLTQYSRSNPSIAVVLVDMQGMSVGIGENTEQWEREKCLKLR